MAAYSVAEAAERLGVSVDTIRRRVRAGELSANLRRGRYVIELDPVESTSVALLRERVASLAREREVLLAEIEDRRRGAEAADRAQAELRQLLLGAQALIARLQGSRTPEPPPRPRG
jgi:excisionase family DNA binding protein